MLNESMLPGFRHIPSTGGGGIKCIISKPISVAAPAATGGKKICFFPNFFLGLSSFTLRFGISKYPIKITQLRQTRGYYCFPTAYTSKLLISVTIMYRRGFEPIQYSIQLRDWSFFADCHVI